MKTIKQKIYNLLWLSFIIFILSVVAGTTIHIFAAFIEPTTTPSASTQDFPENILGANNTDNAFDSSLVTASSTGSIIERLQDLDDSMHLIQDWPGRGWIASSTGNATTSLTQETCEAAENWEWFEDANGDGDYTDPEDGICVKTTTVTSTSWGGTETRDNSYIAAYTCAGSFPNGYVASGGSAAEGCALCVADCYDGRKDLPDQGSYTSPNTDTSGGYTGPITPEVLKNWKGTRLPTATDYYGFCGYKDGGSNYETGCSSDTTFGNYGGMVGRTDKCLDLANGTHYEYFSEQRGRADASISYSNACSAFLFSTVDINRIFRAVFRP